MFKFKFDFDTDKAIIFREKCFLTFIQVYAKCQNKVLLTYTSITIHYALYLAVAVI